MTKKVTPQAAKAALDKERRERAERVMMEIKALLEKENCELLPVVQIRGTRIASSMEIIANQWLQQNDAE